MVQLVQGHGDDVEFLCFSDQLIQLPHQVLLVVKACQAVGVGVGVVDGQKQRKDAEAHAKTCHQHRVVQGLQHHAAGAQQQHLHQDAYLPLAQVLAPEQDHPQRHQNVAQGTAVHQHIPGAALVALLVHIEQQPRKGVQQYDAKQHQGRQAPQGQLPHRHHLVVPQGPHIAHQHIGQQGLEQVEHGGGDRRSGAGPIKAGHDAEHAAELCQHIQPTQQQHHAKDPVVPVIQPFLGKKVVQHHQQDHLPGQKEVEVVACHCQPPPATARFFCRAWSAAFCQSLRVMRVPSARHRPLKPWTSQV